MSKRVIDLCTRLEISFANCESCGARATVKREDGSFWCESCDESAARLGYDAPSTRIKVRISGEYDLDAADLEGSGLPEGDFTDEDAALAARYWWYETEPHPKATLSVEVTRTAFCPGDALPGIDPPPRAATTSAEVEL